MSYYSIAKKASRTIGNHRGLRYIKLQAKTAKSILDVGCGEGTRLNTLLPKTTPGVGVDISQSAIKQAKSQYPRHVYKKYNGKKLPFRGNSFDLVYSAFVLEHVQDPEKFVQEMVRVVKPNGQLVIICPNYGAPNRRSPNSIENPIKKLIFGFIKDFIPNHKLTFTKVRPKKTYQQIDDDTTIEPYILTLIQFLKKNNLKIKKYSSLWELEAKTFNPRKLSFLVLGKLKIFPFKYWGPQIFIAVSKQ